MGSVYGQGAEDAFLPLWRKHIGMVVDYTVGVASNDKAKQDRAVADLIGYTQDFGAFLQSANPNLPKSVVADLVKHHVVTLKAVIDAQASKDQARTYAALRAAAEHMQMIADPLAEAIVNSRSPTLPSHGGRVFEPKRCRRAGGEESGEARAEISWLYGWTLNVKSPAVTWVSTESTRHLTRYVPVPMGLSATCSRTGLPGSD